MPNDKKRQYWDEICQIHLITKHYLLLAEEMSPDGNVFLQPMKEHRDAYDHIIRVYASKFHADKNIDYQEYEKSNMSKALGHEYRAFFDTADWLTLICREEIGELLNGMSKEEIQKRYPAYKELKRMLLDLPEEIATQRESKDIGKKKESILEEIDKYVEILDKLIAHYKGLVIAIEEL